MKIGFLGHIEGKAIAFPFLDVKKMKVGLLGRFDGKAIAFQFMDVKIEKNENYFFWVILKLRL